MLRLSSLNQIHLLCTLGTQVYWSNELYEVRLTKGRFDIVCVSNNFCNALTDSDGNLMDKPNEFFIKDVVSVRGTELRNEMDLDNYLSLLREEAARLVAHKHNAMRRTDSSLESKINTMKFANESIRKHSDHQDYVELHKFRILDLIELATA